MDIPIQKATIIKAHELVKPYIFKTPVLTSPYFNESIGGELFFKCENLQATGSFKIRGATNAILSLTNEERTKGIATHSSGNHGQAVARAANLAGTKAFIVMPSNAAEIKKRGVLAHGGEIVECEPSLEARMTTLKRVIERTGAMEIHPYNNYHVVAGQATAAKELIEEVQDLDVIVTPVGGGGLLSGTALAARYFSSHTHVIGGEPQGADDAYRSFRSGKIETSQENTIADGLRATLGDKTFGIIRSHVHDIIVVTDEEIIHAMQLLWNQMKLVVEPSAVVGLAAVLKQKANFRNKRIGIILTGGNVDLSKAFALLL